MAFRSLVEFNDYVLSFYGPGEIYDYGFTYEEVYKALRRYLSETGNQFCGDSVDREFVRDYVFKMREEMTDPKVRQLS